MEIDHSVTDSADTREYFAATISKEYLIDHKDNGIKLKVFGKNGSFKCEIPSQYIQGFLEAVKQ